MWSSNFILSFSLLCFTNIWQFSVCNDETEGLGSEIRILCKEGWFPFMNSCYKYISDPLNWSDAEARCKSHGSHLVHITNKLVDKYLAEYYELLFFTQTWIGAKKGFGSDSSWVWTDEKPVNYNDWSHQDIFPLVTGEKCACITGRPVPEHIWDIFGARCDTALPFVCEKIAPDSGCGEDLLFNGHCYYFSKRDVTFLDASGECGRKNYTLLEIDGNVPKVLFVEDKISNSWLRDDSPRWELIPSSICYYLRTKVETLHSHLGYGVWQEESCELLKPFICEYPLNNEGLLELNKCEKGTPWKEPIWNWYKGDPFDISEVEECTDKDDIICSPLFECNLKTSACCPRESVFSANERCKEGWEQYSEACYLFRTDIQTYDDAKSDCLSLSGHLANIQDDDELHFIKERFDNAWIGDRHYIDTTEQQSCPKLSDLNKDSATHHGFKECISLRPSVCKYKFT